MSQENIDHSGSLVVMGLADEGKLQPAKSVTAETAPNLFVEANGVRYAYRRFGARSEAPLLFLQHLRGNLDNWGPAVVNPIAKHHDVILLDNAGVGGSSGVPDSSISAMAAHVADFVAALGLETIELLGFSTGGFVAQQFTLDHPAMVRRLVLAGTGPEGGKGMEHYTNEVAAHALIDSPGPEDLVYLFFAPSETSQKAGVAFVQRLGTRAAEPDAPTTLQVRDAQLKAVEAWGAPRGGDYKQLKFIKQPTLVINGVSDVMVPSINSLILAQNLPMALLSLYPDAAHGGLFQYADLFTDQVISFLRTERWSSTTAR
jgi:pimeloyl-ACP methyl ester carboxylesterase